MFQLISVQMLLTCLPAHQQQFLFLFIKFYERISRQYLFSMATMKRSLLVQLKICIFILTMKIIGIYWSTSVKNEM